MSDKKLFLLDGMALIYRAYFAFSKNPRITSYNLNTSAIFGFANTLLDVLQNQKPSHIAVVFDTDKPTERHIEYEAYKAHREAMPEDLSKSIPYIFRLIQGFNIPVITLDGFEADDIIGTLAKKAEQSGFTTYMMTPDKDFGQLVSENIFIYKPARLGDGAETLGVAEICKRWEIQRVEQVIDILGLMGDAVDNIPGVPGVGEVTAKKLIQEFDSVEKLLDNVQSLKGKLKEKIETHADKAVLSKRLATINISCPIDLDETNLRLDAPDAEALKNLFAELEFRNLGKRIFGEDGNVSLQNRAGTQVDLFNQDIVQQEGSGNEKEPATLKTIDWVEHNYILINELPTLKNLCETLQQKQWICIDTETTSLDTMEAELLGVSVCYEPGLAYCIAMPNNKADTVLFLDSLQAIFENENIAKIGQNLKYDYRVLLSHGIRLNGTLFDTMLAHYLIDPDVRHNMDFLAETYLGYKPVSIETLIGKKGSKQGNMRDVDIQKLKEYAAEDADITFQLKAPLESALKEKEAERLFYEIEMPLMPVLADMEEAGVRVDKDFLNEYSKELEVEASKAEAAVYELAGIRFNLASPKQLGEVLFDRLKLDPKAKKTKTGQYQTGEEILSALAVEHDIAKKILVFRQIQKLKSTYVDALPNLINQKTGRVHTSFNQAVAATGRLSSQNPNLQNIPIRTDMGREVRKAFISEGSDYEIMAADYSQIELRIIASISQDAGMIDDFVKGLDIHTATAAKVFGVSLADVDKEMRRKAKMVNFGIIYGISAFGLSQRLEIPRKEAADIIEAYFKQYPGIKRYMNTTIEFARTHGYVETLKGRRRYLRDILSKNQTVRGFAERNAINAPIQGTAADMIKIAMIHIHRDMKAKNLKSRMILQVHDELLFEMHKDEKDLLIKLVEDNMLQAIQLEVPLLVETGIGKNWLEAH